MKFINPVLLVSDEATGKAYARQLSPWEQNLVLQQLQALDGGALKMTEIAPVIVRGVNVSEERARHIVEKQTTGRQRHSGNPQQIPACEHLADFAGQCVECGMSVDEILNGPAPAINLAELVPDEKPDLPDNHSDTEWRGMCDGWNSCRAAMLRNIEEKSK